MGTVGFAQDVHYEAGMTCTDCHDVTNFHGTGEQYDSMWEHATLPSCLDCHEEADPETAELAVHKTHGNDLSCQVCHGQANQNCFECHIEINEDRTSLASHSSMLPCVISRPQRIPSTRQVRTSSRTSMKGRTGNIPRLTTSRRSPSRMRVAIRVTEMREYSSVKMICSKVTVKSAGK